MSTDEKSASEDTGYYRYEVIGDCTHKTSIHNSVKIVHCQRVPVRGITLTVGLFFDGTGNNRANSDDLRLAYAHCANLVGEARAKACAKYEEYAGVGLGNASWQGGDTNISRLFDLYRSSDELSDSETEAQVKAYVSGIGTADGDILIIFSFLPESGKSIIVQALTKQLNALYLRRTPMIIILGELATPAPGTQFLASWTLKVDTTYMATTRLSKYKTNCFPD